MSLISSIYRHGASTRSAAQEAADIERARKSMWHRLGLAVLNPSEITDDWTAQAVRNAAEKIYGKRVDNGKR